MGIATGAPGSLALREDWRTRSAEDHYCCLWKKPALPPGCCFLCYCAYLFWMDFSKEPVSKKLYLALSLRPHLGYVRVWMRARSWLLSIGCIAEPKFDLRLSLLRRTGWSQLCLNHAISYFGSRCQFALEILRLSHQNCILILWILTVLIS